MSVEIPVQILSRFGGQVTLSYTNADTNGMYFENDGNTLLFVKVGTGAAQLLTVLSVAAPGSGRTGDLTWTVANSVERVFGAFSPALWNQKGADAGRVHINIPDATGVQFAAVRITP